MKKIKVLLTAAELTPLAKVGGLADVIGALPKALSKIGVDIRLVIPKYGSIDNDKYPAKKIAENIIVPFNGTDEIINIYETPLPGSEVPIYLIDNEKYLGQNGVYFEKDASSGGSNREAERFNFLARSCFAVFEPLNWWPDIIHCHDWHVGMVPVLAKTLAKTDDRLKDITTLVTIHNLEYQGWYEAKEIFKVLGISANDYPTLKQQKNGQISSLQQAILSGDHLNTVSPNYAQEILTKEYGAGMESTLETKKDKLVGILNGIDVERFDPSTDPDIIANYTHDALSGKEKCKEDLQQTCKLPVEKDTPILGIVTRLADQKGIDLIYEIADNFLKEKVQFVLLGTGDPRLENFMKEVKKNHPENTSITIDFDAHFAQQIYAGSDMFLMPSRFEPCGLGQMIAMRYGTLPVVRATGGLKDTVSDVNLQTGEGDGFVFNDFTADQLLSAIMKSLKLYQQPEKWYAVVKRVMQKDFSWNHSANEYLKLYKQIA